jgi:uncharacterized RDD family membrane protein YckC
MMNDSVREELQTKVGTMPKPIRLEKKTTPRPMAVRPPRIEASSVPQLPPAKLITTELAISKTSPTLVEFQTKHATAPDWRLQLQNAVRQRRGGVHADAVSGQSSQAYQKQLVTSGANALKAQVVEAPAAEKQPVHSDPRVANALNRINKSRNTFLPAEKAEPHHSESAPAARHYPFNIVSRSGESAARPADTKASKNVPAKPRLVSTFHIEKKDFDTNKLPPLPADAADMAVLDTSVPEVRIEAKHVSAFEQPDIVQGGAPQTNVAAAEVKIPAAEIEEIEDLPQFAMRFNAGLFDLIIGSFASIVLLMPFVVMGGDWFSWAGLFAFVPTCMVVMFIYLTTSIAFYGRTFGMRMFSLEMVDAEENEYPTFHQAAVNSSVYLLSLVLGGIGFVPVLFNEEKRAAHDLISGTIVVKEF